MIFTEDKLGRLRELLSLEEGPKKIALLSHTNPDGDTIGAALAWRAYLAQLGHHPLCIAPNRYPYFLEWMDDIAYVNVFSEDTDGSIARFIEEADLIFSMDFNQIGRLDRLSTVVESNKRALHILIDHHLCPLVEGYEVSFSDIHSSSTSFVVYGLIEALGGLEPITRSMAESLYVGFMTDTGNFSFSNLTADLFRAAAVLIDKGVDPPYIYRSIYNNFSEGRMRLLGYLLNDKMVVMHQYGAAYLGLTEEEMRRFEFKVGDSEGFVNYPLAIRGVSLSAMFIQTSKYIRVSLRSSGDVDVNVFAHRYFEGGGHRNAAGGKSFLTMEETIARFKQGVQEYFGENGNSDVVLPMG